MKKRLLNLTIGLSLGIILAYYLWLKVFTGEIYFKQKEIPRIGGFTLMNNDSIVLFDYFNGECTSIYTMPLYKSGEPILVMPCSDSLSYYHPISIANDSNIIMLGEEPRSEWKFLFKANLITKKVEKLIEFGEKIHELIYSIENNTLYLVIEEATENYLPEMGEIADGFDIYSFNLSTLKRERVTYLNKRQFFSISNVNKDSLLLFTPNDEVNPNTLSFCDLQNRDRLIPINARNRKDNTLFSCNDTYFSRLNKSILLSYGFGFRQLNAEGEVNDIYITNAGKRISSLSLFSLSPKILFTIQDEMNFYSINMDGSNFKKYNIEILPPTVDCSLPK